MRRYPGGKNEPGTWQWILGRMPTHAGYVEGCVGSGAVLRRKVPALETIAIDRDPRIVDHWRRVRYPGLKALRTCVVAWLRRNRARLDADWLVYLDPPYLPETRAKKKVYRYEMTTAEHVELLDVVKQLRCRVILSGYASKLYDDALRGWSRHTRRVRTKWGAWRTEVLWCNFTADASKDFAARIPGRDYRERERIKKRVVSWSGKFAKMPAYERTAVLGALLRAEARHGRGRSVAKRSSSPAASGGGRRRGGLDRLPPFSVVAAAIGGHHRRKRR